MIKISLLPILFAAGCCAAEPIIGVGTHFAWKRDYLETLLTWSTESRTHSVRDELYWKDIEKSPGTLKMDGRAAFSLDRLTKSHSAGIKPLIILSYGNPNYDSGSQPHTHVGRLAFARYAKFVFDETKHISPIFEIWNEWNIGAGTNPKTKIGSPSDYVELVRTTASELRKAGFTGKILGGAVGDDYPNWQWTRQAISLGLLDLVDGISIHLYNYSNTKNRRGAPEFLRRTSELNSYISSKNGGRSFPIYITEVGWPNHIGLKSISREEAAIDAEILLNELSQYPYIKGVWFYEFQDGGSDPFEKEHHFGILDRNGIEKPVACAIRHWSKLNSSITWTGFSQANGISTATGRDLKGNLVTRVWPSAIFGEDRARFSLTPMPTNDRRTIYTASCEVANGTGKPFSKDQFPTDKPVTVVTPRGLPAPTFFRLD